MNGECRKKVQIDLNKGSLAEDGISTRDNAGGVGKGDRILHSTLAGPKLERGHLMKRDSSEVDIDALLKAVIDISDRLQEHEDKFNVDKGAPHEPEHIHGSQNLRLGPDTAVRRYHERDDILDGDNFDVYPEGPVATYRDKSPKHHRPLTGRTSAPEFKKYSRKNMSFSNEKVNSIDHENQRLLKEIQKTKACIRTTKSTASVRATSAATVNRNKHQERINRENLAMLRRLEAVKATPCLRRDYLLREHIRAEVHAQRIAKCPMPSGASTPRSLFGNAAGKYLSNSSETESVASSSKLNLSSRSSSGGSRSKRSLQKSRSSVTVQTVPVWEPGW